MKTNRCNRRSKRITQDRRTLLAVDLFSGCGGLTLGLKQAGFRVIGAIDVDALAVETYRKNHPDTMIWRDDIRAVNERRFRLAIGLRRGRLDLLAACPPCEGFSTLRTLRGGKDVHDDRNELVLEILRFVRELAPKAIMVENVPGLAEDERLLRFRRALAAMGYRSRVGILDAADYGVPQRRRRMILLAGRKGRPEFAETLTVKKTVRHAIGTLPAPNKSADALHKLVAKHSAKVRQIINRVPKDGGSRLALGVNAQLRCHKRCSGFFDVYGRMAWDDVAPTITSGCINPSKGRFLHPRQNRAISLREAALLQSFPRGYWFSLRRGIYAAAEMIGNALPPAFVRHHARKVRAFLEGQSCASSK